MKKNRAQIWILLLALAALVVVGGHDVTQKTAAQAGGAGGRREAGVGHSKRAFFECGLCFLQPGREIPLLPLQPGLPSPHGFRGSEPHLPGHDPALRADPQRG